MRGRQWESCSCITKVGGLKCAYECICAYCICVSMYRKGCVDDCTK